MTQGRQAWVGENARLTFAFRSYAPLTWQNDDSSPVKSWTGAIWARPSWNCRKMSRAEKQRVVSSALRERCPQRTSLRLPTPSLHKSARELVWCQSTFVDAAQRDEFRSVSCDQRKPR